MDPRYPQYPPPDPGLLRPNVMMPQSPGILDRRYPFPQPELPDGKTSGWGPQRWYGEFMKSPLARALLGG